MSGNSTESMPNKSRPIPIWIIPRYIKDPEKGLIDAVEKLSALGFIIVLPMYDTYLVAPPEGWAIAQGKVFDSSGKLALSVTQFPGEVYLITTDPISANEDEDHPPP